MNIRRFLDRFFVRNTLGFMALVLVHYVSDQYSIDQRSGFVRFSPYLFLLLLYGWIVFHNRILFERYFLTGKRFYYFSWLLFVLALSSFNMNFILQTEFQITRTLPYIVSFYVFTLTGLGVFVLYRFLDKPSAEPAEPGGPVIDVHSTSFSFIANGVGYTVPQRDILYIESLENYQKIVLNTKTHITRLTLKDVEERLPKERFVRISRSHILNKDRIEEVRPDEVVLSGKTFRIGRVYKRYVTEMLVKKPLAQRAKS